MFYQKFNIYCATSTVLSRHATMRFFTVQSIKKTFPGNRFDSVESKQQKLKEILMEISKSEYEKSTVHEFLELLFVKLKKQQLLVRL